MAPKSNFCNGNRLGTFFYVEKYQKCFIKSRFWRIMGGGGARTPIIHVRLLLQLYGPCVTFGVFAVPPHFIMVLLNNFLLL